MAYTKIYAIRARLDKKVAYVINEEKTGLDSAIQYAENPAKTEHRLFTTALNCESKSTAYAEMQATKCKWGKETGVLGYHVIQSFAPGEVTPEQAHALGVEFARRCFGTDFEVVVGTHLDRHHLHSHIVVNSVSFADGHKYHSSPKRYYGEIRLVSDELCRENNLSVIAPHGGDSGKQYVEWAAEQKGEPTVRGVIRADMDSAIRRAYTYKSFWEELRRQGYEIKAGPNVKHTAVRPPGRSRFFRLDKLGAEYTEEAIRARLQRQRTGGAVLPVQPPVLRHEYRCRGSFRKVQKLHGFKALYFHYLYFLGKVKKGQPRRAPRALRADVIRFDRYVAQSKFLTDNRIGTTRELELYQDAVEASIEALTEIRQGLYAERRDCHDEAQKAALSAEIARQTQRLRALRGERGMCRRIAEDAARIYSRVLQAGRTRPETQKNRPKREVR